MHWIHENPFVLYLFFLVWSAIVSSMPSVDEVKPFVSPGRLLFYQFLYKLLHLSAGNTAKLADFMRLNGGTVATVLGKTTMEQDETPK